MLCIVPCVAERGIQCSSYQIALTPCCCCVQLKDILTRTVDTWVDLFDESNKDHLPQLCMELMYERHEILFNPSYEDLEDLVLFVVQHIAQTLQSVSGLCVEFICSCKI